MSYPPPPQLPPPPSPLPSPASPASGYGPPMGYPPPLSPPRRPRRPMSVTVAIALFMVGFVVLMIDSATLVAAQDEFAANIDAAAQGTDVSDEELETEKSATSGQVYLGACSPLVLSLALLPMGLFVLRGRSAMRIALCVTGGVAILCSICCSSMTFLPPAEDTEFYQRLHEANMQTRPLAFLILPGIAVLAWSAAVILLLLPESNAYFASRKQPASYA